MAGNVNKVTAAYARVRGNARGRDGGIREELAAGVRFRRQTGKTFARSKL